MSERFTVSQEYSNQVDKVGKQNNLYETLYNLFLEDESYQRTPEQAAEAASAVAGRGSCSLKIGEKLYKVSDGKVFEFVDGNRVEVSNTQSDAIVKGPGTDANKVDRPVNSVNKVSEGFTESGNYNVQNSLLLSDPPSRPSPADRPVPAIRSSDIDITYAQLEENISALKKSISTLKSSWDQDTKRNIDTINNSWAGNDCSAYTTKLSQMDGKVQNTIQALELLCSTYEKARDMIAQSQRNVSGAINSL